MKRFVLLLFVFSSLVFSSCAVPEDVSTSPQDIIPEETSPSAQEIVPDADVPVPPEVLPVETPPVQVEIPVADNSDKTVETLEFIYPFVGDEAAPVTIVEYGDFSDIVNSRATISQVAAIKRDYVTSGKVKLVFKPFPLSGTDDAKLASAASLCMWKQGSVQFWAYHNTLFAYFSHLDEVSLKNYASRVPNFNKPSFVECLDSRKYSDVVSATLADGEKKGIRKVPSFVIGTSVFEGDVSYKTLKSAIERELGHLEGSLITGNAIFSQSGFYDVQTSIIDSLKSVFRKI